MSPTLKVVLKFLWYIVSRIFIWAVAAALVVLSFFAAMDFMNAQILVKDGLQLRAEVIIKGDDPTALTRVFSKGFLEQDTQLSAGTYHSYAVSGIDYNASVNFLLILPWQDTIVLRVTEKVTGIKGNLLASTANAELIDDSPPHWQNAVYDVRVTRYEGNWRIVAMDMIETLPMPTPSPGVSPSPTPVPSPTLVPSPGAEPDLETEPEEIIED